MKQIKHSDQKKQTSSLQEQPGRLEFLRDLLHANGISFNEVARRLGVTRAAVDRWFKKDDIRLSTMKRICECCNYTFNLHLCRSAYVLDDPAPLIKRCAGKFERGHLLFLCEAMSRERITIRAIADRLGLSHTGVESWFKSNDMALSRVESVAVAFGLSVRIELMPKDIPSANPYDSHVELRPHIFDRNLA